MEGGDEEQAPFERVELGAAFADADVSPFLPRASLSQRALCTACASHRSVRSHPPDAAQRRTTGATCAAALPSSSLAHFAGAASPPLLRSCVATTSAIGARPDRFALLAHRRCPLSALLQLAVPPPPRPPRRARHHARLCPSRCAGVAAEPFPASLGLRPRPPAFASARCASAPSHQLPNLALGFLLDFHCVGRGAKAERIVAASRAVAARSTRPQKVRRAGGRGGARAGSAGFRRLSRTSHNTAALHARRC